MSDSHIAILPTVGMNNLVPLLRLAASLVKDHKCKLTVVIIHPTVMYSESMLLSLFFDSFPQITRKELNIPPFDPSTANEDQDPFYVYLESISHSAHLLTELLFSVSVSSPLSSIITDSILASAFLPHTQDFAINYVFFNSSAKMLSLFAYYPKIVESSSEKIEDNIEIPGLSPIPKSWLPPLLSDKDNLFTTQFLENGRKIVKSYGILINTFEHLEKETVEALNDGKVVHELPRVVPIGPLVSLGFEGGSDYPLEWLDGEKKGSVVYVSFGGRTTLSTEQIKELGVGLVKSGCRFLWEEDSNLEEVLGNELMEEMNEKGLVLEERAKQDVILGHPSVGGFVSHCGWDSIIEAARQGVPILAWPQDGDQRINASVVEKNGFGLWVKSWGWGAEGEVLVKGEEIGEKIKEMMSDEGLKSSAANVKEEAKKAEEAGGVSKIFELWK